MQKPDLVEIVAIAAAGDPGCCGQRNADGRCCMTRISHEIFQALKNAGGPSLKDCEAIAQGRARIVPVGVVANRDKIKCAIEVLDELDKGVQSLPYREARPLIARISELRGIIGMSLPGGYYGACPNCGEVKGHDEMISLGDVDFCEECAPPIDREADGEKRALMQAAAALEGRDV